MEFIFRVLSAAVSLPISRFYETNSPSSQNELLLDKLILLCSSVILRHVTIANVCSLLEHASHYHATQLVHSLQSYVAVNIETLLEGRYLSDLPHDLIRELSSFIRDQQFKKFPGTRSSHFIDRAMGKFGSWLALQDIPQPLVRSAQAHAYTRQSPTMSPVMSGSKALGRHSSPRILPSSSPRTSSILRDDEHPGHLFSMDGDPAIFTPNQQGESGSSSGVGVPWKDPFKDHVSSER